MNTEISYLYRDAANYKQGQSAIVMGEMTDAEKADILASRFEGEYFIPYQVGLEEMRFGKLDDDDHIWFELYDDAFSYTNQPPTVQMSASELADLFRHRAGNWDEMEAHTRLFS